MGKSQNEILDAKRELKLSYFFLSCVRVFGRLEAVVQLYTSYTGLHI